MAIRAHKSRSILTILGIVVGITSIIIVMSIGEGAKNLILSQIQGLGSKTIAILPGREPTSPTDVAQLMSDSLKDKDLQLLENKSNVPNVSDIMPVVFGGETAYYDNNTYRITVFGATDLVTKIFDIYPSQGNFFTAEDVRSKADVAIIGSKVKDKLFGPSDAIGQRIKINNKSFRVIGVFGQKGQVSFFNFDEMAVVPYTTAQQYVFGIKYFHRIIVEADSETNLDSTVKDIQITLRNSHGITDPTKDDFSVQTSADLAQRLGTITDILTLLLTSVAAISLVVGGIGIMNIMLVSVTERTREIGLRKALGATNRNILLQFLLEAIALTGLGGVVGILLGSGISFAVAIAVSRFLGLNWVFTFPINGAIIGIVVSTAIGLIFGLYPARQAARKDPIEALRYE